MEWNGISRTQKPIFTCIEEAQFYLNTSTTRKGWSLEKNFYSSRNGTFPRRGRPNGAREDLYIVLKEITDRDMKCDEHTRAGYKVYLHHPADVPQVSLHSYSVQPGKTTSIAIKLDILDTAEELRGYDPDIRQCYFPSERCLQYFQKYTSLNCQLECLTNYTIKNCGCVSFYMPRNASINICQANEWKCIDESLDNYAAIEDLNDGKNSQCRCLPSCRDVNYDADIILTKLDLDEYNERILETDDLEENETFYDDNNNEEDNGEENDYNYYSGGDILETDDNHERDLDNDASDMANSDKNYGTADDDSSENDSNTESNIYAANDYNDHKNNESDVAAADDTNDEPSTDITDDEPTVNIKSKRITEIRIYYRRPRFVAMERSELVGLSQFLADVGGTLGLFLGFSFLTLAEIFYFFTLKLCCRFKQQTSKKETVDKSNDTNDV